MEHLGHALAQTGIIPGQRLAGKERAAVHDPHHFARRGDRRGQRGVGNVKIVADREKRPVADDVSKLFCEYRALNKFIDESPAAKALLPTTFERRNEDAPLRLARSFLTLDQALANERKTYRQVAGACEKLGMITKNNPDALKNLKG